MPEGQLKVPNSADKLFISCEELSEPEVAKITGNLPKWVKGHFIRLGPGKFDLTSDFCMNHWLDGFAMLSKFHIDAEQGTVEFDKKFIQSDAYKRALIVKRPVLSEFGTKAYTDSNKSFFSRILTFMMPETTDNCCSNVFRIGDEFFVANDMSYFRQFDPVTLKTGEKFDTNKLFGLQALSSHPMTDPITKDTYIIGFSVMSGVKFSLMRISSANALKGRAKESLKKAKTVCTIPSSFGSSSVSLVHSFGMSSNYIVFIEQPYIATLGTIAASALKGAPLVDWFSWKGNTFQNRFHIIDKKSGKCSKTEIKPEQSFFFLHVVNCFETNNEIIVDIVAMDNAEIFDTLFLTKLRSGILEKMSQPCIKRFRLPIEAASTKSSCIVLKSQTLTSENGCETPVIDPCLKSKDYDSVYLNGTIAENSYRNTITKLNLNDRSTISWKNDETVYPSEPAFLSCNKGQDDGDAVGNDGVLVTAVTSSVGSPDFLVFLCAKTLKEIARATFKAHVPLSLHGIFLPENS